MNYPTPHIKATPEDFGQTVLMPGDPLRSKYIAENFLENPKLVNNVRGVQGYTGYYKGMKVSVMASGMGIPSIGIYSYELYNAYGVQNIMRIGSAGSINPDIHVRDIVIAQGACTDSNFWHQYHVDGHFAPIASFAACGRDLLRGGRCNVSRRQRFVHGQLLQRRRGHARGFADGQRMAQVRRDGLRDGGCRPLYAGGALG